jgi:hypothetical protein
MTPKTAAMIFRANIGISFILAGVLWATGAIPGVGALTQWAFDFLNWPIDGNPGDLNPIAKFMSAIGGGILAGFGVLNWLLVAPAIESRDTRVLNAALASIFTWAVIDSTGSVLSGAAPNVFFNLIILALYVIPIVAVRGRP